MPPGSEPLILASTSPRRRELLAGCGLRFQIEPPYADENALPHEPPAQLVQRLALAKAASVARGRPEAWIIGADTVVVLDNEILGKPRHAEEAVQMLTKLQGREHLVLSGCAVLNPKRKIEKVFHSLTRVRFVPMHLSAIRKYVQSGEPLDKAGAYAIQGKGAALVAEINGSYTNVVGLDLAKLMEVLESLGFFCVMPA